MTELKVVRIGDAVGIVLPEDIRAKLKVGEGDTVVLADAPDGFRLRPRDPEFERQMAVAREVMERRRRALAELAK